MRIAIEQSILVIFEKFSRRFLIALGRRRRFPRHLHPHRLRQRHQRPTRGCSFDRRDRRRRRVRHRLLRRFGAEIKREPRAASQRDYRRDHVPNDAEPPAAFFFAVAVRHPARDAHRRRRIAPHRRPTARRRYPRRRRRRLPCVRRCRFHSEPRAAEVADKFPRLRLARPLILSARDHCLAITSAPNFSIDAICSRVVAAGPTIIRDTPIAANRSMSAGFNCSRSLLTVSSSGAVRPAARSCSRSRLIVAASSSIPSAIPYHPSPSFAARLSDGSVLPPNTIGGCGRCTGLGMNLKPSIEIVLPCYSGDSLLHSSFISATYSRVRSARSLKLIPTASNSSSSHPIPTPKINHPPESTSRLATALAVANALRIGSTNTPVASRIFVVIPATNASANIGSCSGVSGGTPIL